MPKPSKTALSEDGDQACGLGSVKNFTISDVVLPPDVQDAAQTTHVKRVELLFLRSVHRP